MNMPKERRTLTIGLVGNPNCGKTTLFNALTGIRLKTANWPGVTVEKASGWLSFEGIQIHLIDLPGIYSLDDSSTEEKETGQWLQTGGADVIINVADSSVLERSLALTLQLTSLDVPVVLAVNQFGRKTFKGQSQPLDWNLGQLQRCLGGLPCLSISARKGTGLYELLRAASAAACSGGQKSCICSEFCYRSIEQRYQYIEEICSKCHEKTEHGPGWTDRADRWLMHPVLGIPIFLFLMAFVFFLTFSVGNIPKHGIARMMECCLETVEYIFSQTGTAQWLKSLVLEGIIPGVGSVLSFLPNMIILFFALSILEESGYMARVSYVMNETMGMAGLSGKAFLPLMLGFGCTVPAVVASRIVEGDTQRKRTILAAHFMSCPARMTGKAFLPLMLGFGCTVPAVVASRIVEGDTQRKRTILAAHFMSCPARMTVYVLFSQMFFTEHAVLAACSIYLAGMGAAVLTAVVHWKLSGERRESCLLLELPEYRMPSVTCAALCVWDKTEEYLAKAGTTILLSSVFLWFLVHTGPSGLVSDIGSSFAASAGRLLEPFFTLAGIGNWKAAAALLSGLSAKEAVVSGFSVLYGIKNIGSATGMAQFKTELLASGFGPVNAYALMIFCLLYTPCAAGMAVIRSETKDLKWTIFMAAFQLLFAFMAAAAVYHIGSILFPG